MSHPPNSRSSSFASGTKSLISGVRPSLRLPRRTVASWVSDPIGTPAPRFTASTPAIKVVATAPIPGIRTPSLPSAGAIRTLSLLATEIRPLPFLEARRKIGGEGLLRMQFLRALDQRFLGFWIFRIGDAAVHRAYRRALFLIKEPDAFGALVGNDVIDVLHERGMSRAVQFPFGRAFVNRGVGAFGLAGTAVDALLGYYGGHLFLKTRERFAPQRRSRASRVNG